MTLALRYDWGNADGTLNELTLTDLAAGVALALTRATERTVVDYNNILRTCRSGEFGVTGGRRVENTAPHSNELDQSAWTPSNSQIAQTGPVSPGGNTSWLLDSVTGGTGVVSMRNSEWSDTFPLELNNTYTVSMYFQANQNDWVQMAINNWTGGSVNCFFDLTNGVVGTTVNTVAEGITDEGDGWFRCWITFTETAGDNNANATMAVADSDGDVSVDRNNSSLYLADFQAEDVTGQNDFAPSEYQDVTGVETQAVQWYATKRRTNLLLESETLENWSPTNSTLSDGEESINGISLTKITDNSSDNKHGASRIAVSPSFAQQDKDYVFSAYVKAGTSPYIGFAANTFNGVGDIFNTATGAWTKTDNYAGHGSVDLGNGYYRIYMLIASTISGTPGGDDFQFIMSDDGTNLTYIGSGDTVYAGGAQLERGTSITDYIPTTDTIASSGFDTAITPAGLRVNEARTNLCLQSEDLTTTWNEGGDTLAVVGDEAIAPDGTLTADMVVDNSATGPGNDVFVTQAIGIPIDTVYAYSAYIKADQSDWAYMSVIGLGTVAANCYFDLANVAVGSTPGASVLDTFIEDAGNGWYRCGFSFTSDSADTTGSMRLYVAEADNDFNHAALDGTNSLFFWGAQLEVGAFPTSYIPTVAASVTRNADHYDSSDVTWYNESAGTFYVKMQHVIASVTGSEIMCALDAGGSNYWRMNMSGGAEGRYRSDARSGGSAQWAQFGDHEAGLNAVQQMASAAEEDNVITYLDGVETGGSPDTSALMPASIPTAFDVGQASNASFFNGDIGEIRYYNTRVDDATLEDMSNGIFGPSAGVTAAYSNGTAITNDGGIRIALVAADYAEQAGDIYINGTRHDANGIMYCTSDAVGASTVSINGIAHSTLGVRHVQEGDTTNKWPEGFAVDADGRQAYLTALVAPSSIRGIARESDGAVLFYT